MKTPKKFAMMLMGSEYNTKKDYVVMQTESTETHIFTVNTPEQAVEYIKAGLDKLNQGYSYVEKEGKAITSVQDVKEGDLLEICVSDGKITARAEKTSAVSWMEQS